MRRSTLSLSIAAAFLACADPAVAPDNAPLSATKPSRTASITLYGVKDLGTLGGESGIARDINDAGQVVGSASTGAGGSHAFLWENGVMRDLDPTGPNSTAWAINNAGQIVGVRNNRAFLWDNGTFVWTGPFSSEAYDVSDNGHVVGRMQSGGGWRGFVWHNGGLTVIPTLGGTNSFANAVNSAGVVVGHSTNAAGHTRAFRWENGVMTDIGSLGGTSTIAEGINDAGVIVGRAMLPSVVGGGGGLRAFRWNGTMQALSTSSSEAWGLNEAGDVVGQVLLSGRRAALWNGGSQRALPLLAGSLSIALAVNESGEAAGWAVGATGHMRPVIWTEVTDPFKPFVSQVSASPNPVATGAQFTLTAVANDANTGGSAIASAMYYDTGNVRIPMSASDGAFDEAIESVVAQGTASAPGLHSVCVEASDVHGNVSNGSCFTLVVYDPGSSAQGGGALAASDGSGNDGNFSLRADYRGDGELSGFARFQLQDRSVDFRSSELKWLVVTGSSLVLQGTGLVDGQLAPTNHPYDFTIWMSDGDPDTFRLRITYQSLGSDIQHYDSGVRTLNGSVRIEQ